VEPRTAAARLIALTGRVDRGGAAVSEGDEVSFGDAVLCRTGTALLELADGSRVALRADTLAALVQQGDEIRVRLSRGEAAFKVSRREDRFAVETSHGTATVKGTVFSVRTGMLSSVVTVA
jgi:ferric-dicitrate binding protein FerR (iron transport regulator)